MSTTRILPVGLVDSLDEHLSLLALSDEPTVRREAERLRTLIDKSSRENGGPAVISQKEYDALLVLLGKERLI
jgi:hypothetical protein